MMRFPLTSLLGEQACCDFLLQRLHPTGLAYPHGHTLPAGQAPPMRILGFAYRATEFG